MSHSRRRILQAAGAGAASLILPARGLRAEARELHVAGTTVALRDVILAEFAKRSGVEVRPWLNPSVVARIDRVRTTRVDSIEVGADFVTMAWEEKVSQPIDTARLKNWSKIHPVITQGKAAADVPFGLGDNPARTMFVGEDKTKLKFLPGMFQMDSIGYNSKYVEAPNNELSWGELFNPKYRGKVAIYGFERLGMLDAALGMEALGLFKPKDVTNLTEKEVDTVIDFLKEKKKEGHFRAMWKTYGELVNLMASEEVWIADAWWPVVVEVAKKGVPTRYAAAKEGFRAWCTGYALTANARNVDEAYAWLNFWADGFAGARQSEIGYFSPYKTAFKYLSPEETERWYGASRDGGSIEQRMRKIYVWNTMPKNMDYYTERWNEFLAS